MTTDSAEPVLVLAPTGKTGGRVADRLHAAGVAVRPGSRGTEPPFDWEDEQTWPPVLRGVRGVYLAYSPDLIVPGAGEVVARFAAAARTAGADRIVMLSGRGEPEARSAEEAVRAVGPPLTVVRASWFVQNLTEGGFADMVAQGVVALPVGDVREPFVDCDDIADVAVAALLDDGHLGCTYDVTGPEALTFAELTEELAGITGRTLDFVELTAAEAEVAWRDAGVPEETIWLLLSLFGTVFDGRNTEVGDGVPRALGRPARDVRGHLVASTGSPSR